MNAQHSQLVIDLNADFGEAVTPEQLAVENVVVGFVTSVNIACGGHTGDEASMRHAIQSAAHHGVAIGAHPSFPDRENFGRAHMSIDPAALRTTISEQITSLYAIAQSEGVALTHCKPHGALYHASSANESIARAFLHACADINPNLRLTGQAGSQAIAWWKAWGGKVTEEAFVDRIYEADGSVRSRARPNALLTDPDAAAAQACRIATTQSVYCADGATLSLKADTLCLHSDTQNAAAIAEHVARSLHAAGVKLHPPT